LSMKTPASLLALIVLLAMLSGCATYTVSDSTLSENKVEAEAPVPETHELEVVEPPTGTLESVYDSPDCFIFESEMPGVFLRDGKKIDVEEFSGKVGFIHSEEEDGLYRIDIEGEKSIYYSPEEGEGYRSLFDRSGVITFTEMQEFLQSFEKNESLCFASSLTIVGARGEDVEISNGMVTSKKRIEELRSAAIYLPFKDVDEIAAAIISNDFIVRTFPDENEVILYSRADGNDANADLGLYYESGKERPTPVLFLDYLVKEGIKPTKVTVSAGNIGIDIKGVESSLTKKSIETRDYYLVTSTIELESAVDLLLSAFEENLDVHFTFRALFGSFDVRIAPEQLKILWPLLSLTRIKGEGRVHYLNLK